MSDFIAGVTQIWTVATFPVAIVAGIVLGLVIARLRFLQRPSSVLFWLLTVGVFWFAPVIVARLLTVGQYQGALVGVGSLLVYIVFSISAATSTGLFGRPRWRMP